MTGVHLITYGDSMYTRSRGLLLEEARMSKWFDSVNAYSAIDPEFYSKFEDVLSMRRGGGYWIWKPYYIMKRLKEIPDDDVLLYMDAGCSINTKGYPRFKFYLEKLQEWPYLTFQMPSLPERHWTSDSIFEYFKVDPSSKIATTGQNMATICMFRKCDISEDIVSRWLQVLQDDRLLFTDFYNNLTTRSDFRDNRHDQSVFSVIRKMDARGYTLEDETWFRNFNSKQASLYPLWAIRRKG